MENKKAAQLIVEAHLLFTISIDIFYTQKLLNVGVFYKSNSYRKITDGITK